MMNPDETSSDFLQNLSCTTNVTSVFDFKVQSIIALLLDQVPLAVVSKVGKNIADMVSVDDPQLGAYLNSVVAPYNYNHHFDQTFLDNLFPSPQGPFQNQFPVPNPQFPAQQADNVLNDIPTTFNSNAFELADNDTLTSQCFALPTDARENATFLDTTTDAMSVVQTVEVVKEEKVKEETSSRPNKRRRVNTNDAVDGKPGAGCPSTACEKILTYGRNLMRFPRVAEDKWIVVAEEHDFESMSKLTAKRGLQHYKICKWAPREIVEQATLISDYLIRSKPDSAFKANNTCEYCEHRRPTDKAASKKRKRSTKD
jgi:hypothetical protein